MDRNITKKRKLKEEDAVTNGIAPAKKSKQVKPVSMRADESEEDDENDNDEEEEEEDENEDEEDNNEEEDAEEDEEEAINVADLPAGAVPVLPPSAADAASFEELKLSDKTMQAIGEMGFTKMTSIQRAVRISAALLTSYPALLTST